jgi:putative endonuclease
MKNVTSYEKGVRAEQIACTFFQKKGYLLLEKRYKTPFGEIDLILEKSQTLILAEIKYRKKCFFDFAINDFQKKRIQESYLFYISQNSCFENCDCRFDVILLQESFDRHLKLTHIKNAFFNLILIFIFALTVES